MHSDFAQLSSLSSADADYRFGRPTVYLSAHELARLTIVRSKLGDTRAERAAEALPSRRAASVAAASARRAGRR